MSYSYIIKNCPTLMGNRLCYGKVTKQCADCTDCLLKQIADMCKRASHNDLHFTPSEILSLLEIEESEE